MNGQPDRPSPVRHSLPPSGVAMPRDLAFERRLTFDAASTLTAVPPERLITLSEARAAGRPVLDVDQRNFGREMLEELADARNYACWWLAQAARGAGLNPHLAGDLTQVIGQAIAATALAFEHTDRAQSLTVDWRRP